MEARVAQSALVRPPLPLKRFLIASVGGHLLLVAVLLIANQLDRPAPLNLDQKPIRATLVRRGKPRDQKLLPRKEELPPPPKAAEPVPLATPPPPAVKPAAVAVPVPGAKPTPTAAAKPTPQDGAKDAADRRRSLFGAFSKSSKAAQLDELDGEEDGDPNGNAAVAEGERYYAVLSSAVQRFYDVADTIPADERARLKAQVVLRIGKTGSLVYSELLKPSGNDLFDNAVLAAVKKAQPFSPPPENLRDALQKTGVVLEFSP